MQIPKYIELAKAMQQYGLSRQFLLDAARNGLVGLVDGPGGLAVSKADVEGIVSKRQQFPQPEDFEHLRGQEIWISEAARKYGVSQPTISKWVGRGYIRRLGREMNRVLLDEADVAYRVAVYHAQDGRPGRRIFDKAGNPYIPKDPRTLAARAA